MRVSVYWLLIVTKLNLPKKDDAGPGKNFMLFYFLKDTLLKTDSKWSMVFKKKYS